MAETEDFHVSAASRPTLRSTRPLFLKGTLGLSLGLGGPGYEVDHFHLMERLRMYETTPDPVCLIETGGGLYLLYVETNS